MPAVRFRAAARRERQVARRRRRVDAARADRARRRRHHAEHRRYEREDPGTFELDGSGVLPAARRRARAPDGADRARAARPTASSRRTAGTAASSASSATTTRATPATWSRRWRRPSTATRRWSRLFADARRGAGSSRRLARGVAAFAAQPRRRVPARASSASIRLTPTIVEVVVQRAGGRAPLRARASSTGCRTSRRCADARRRRDGPAHADGRPRAHRRLGGPGAGAALDDRARDGRLEPPLRATCSPASRWC